MKSLKYIVLLFIPLMLNASWEILDLPTDRGFTSIWAINEQTIFVSGDQGLWKTFDGIEWVMDTGYQTSCIYFVDDTLGFLGGYYITTDGGKTWQLGDTVNGGVGSISFPKGQSLTGYGSGYDDVRKTTDGCWHWEILPPLPDVYPTSSEHVYPGNICFPSDPDTGYLSVDCVEIVNETLYIERYSYFKTTDGGQTWVLNEEGLWNEDFRPHLVDFPQNASAGYMAGTVPRGEYEFEGYVYKTTNGGASWDTVLKDLPHIASICFPETDQVGYVFGDSLAHKTTDGGKTWKVAYLTHDSVWGHSHFLNNRVGFITGKVVNGATALYNPYYPGFILKTTDGLLGITEEDAVPESPDLQVSAIGSQVVLRYSGFTQGLKALVFDASGRKVAEIEASGTSGEITWGECYGSGVYFIRAKNGAGGTRKVILVK